jgi:hypothetical protein
VLEKQKKRFQFLYQLYREQETDPEKVGYNMIEVGNKCGLDKVAVKEVAGFLIREGLIETPILGPIVRITHKGMLEVESAFENPGSKTNHFPPYIIQEISLDITAQEPNQSVEVVSGIGTKVEVEVKSKEEDKKWDVFISHASEDKDSIARPLAERLQQKGLRVWYDEQNVKWGTRLLISIDEGLRNSKYGIVIFSKNFFKKEWTQRELEGLFALMLATGRDLILPIRHGITQKELTMLAPMFADIFNKSSDEGIDNLVKEVCKIMKSEPNSDTKETIASPLTRKVMIPESKSKGEIMWEGAYREHSRSIGGAIFQGWNKSSGILASFSYQNGKFRRTDPKEKTINELQYADYAKLHLQAGYPDILKLVKQAQDESVAIASEAESVANDFEKTVIEAITTSCPELPGTDHYDPFNVHNYYKTNVLASVFLEAEMRTKGPSRVLPKIGAVTRSITGPNGETREVRFHELTFGAFTIAWGDLAELEALSSVIDSLMSDSKIQTQVSKFKDLEKELRDSQIAENLHNAVLKIGQDSRDMPIEGEGSCTICARLFKDLLGK